MIFPLMKFRLLKLLIIAVLAITSLDAFSQNCLQFERKACKRSDMDEFKFNSQSKSGLFGSSDKSELNIVVYAGQDYRISFCAGKILGETVAFVIKDAKTKEVLYDNAQEDFIQQFEFSCEATRRLIIEVGIYNPDGDGGGGRKRFDTESSDCLGILIENMATPKIGF